MKKIVVFFFALGLVPALLHAEEGCVCPVGDLACLNKCVLSKADTAQKNVKADKQKAVNNAKAQKKAAKAKKEQAKKDAKTKRGEVRNAARSAKEAAKAEKQAWQDLAE